MKKLIFIIIANLIGIIGYGQNFGVPVSDSGYYFGMVNDSLCDKFIFISFLTNDGDNVIHIVPYIINDLIDSTFIHNNYQNIFKQELTDSIDGNVFLDNGWNIPGFDNYCYYNINEEIVSFSLNIANRNKQYLDVFQFKGSISDNGEIIESVISSTDSIFQKSTLILKYQEK